MSDPIIIKGGSSALTHDPRDDKSRLTIESKNPLECECEAPSADNKYMYRCKVLYSGKIEKFEVAGADYVINSGPTGKARFYTDADGFDITLNKRRGIKTISPGSSKPRFALGIIVAGLAVWLLTRRS